MNLSIRFKGLIGILGGSFNPAHSGHVYISMCAIKKLNLSSVWWLVTPQNPLKESAEYTSIESRVRFAKKLTANLPIRVITIENILNICYSYSNVNFLRKKYPYHRFVWIMGADVWHNLERWRYLEYFLRRIPVAVFSRGNERRRCFADIAFRKTRLSSPAMLQTTENGWFYFRIKKNQMSSTKIRGGYDKNA